MQKHRKKKPVKKIAVALGALGIVAVPTVAVACWDAQDTGRTRATSQQERRPWQSAPTAAPTFQAPVDVPPPSSPPAASPSSPAATPAQPVVRTSPPTQPPPQPQPTKPPVVTKQPAPQPPKTSAPPASGAAAAVLSLVNQERAAAGCPALTLNAKLTKAAQDHSADMAAHGTMSHTGSDGSDAGQRITRAGYTWSSYGENVAYGYSTAEKVMEGWMNSPGHRQNILNCSFKEIGIGLAQPNSYWTQDFGTAR
ncbi:CAP domain-containing protein [Streptomyces sp. ISL-86]|uniref:CAP domain-containing protein n=1 Tax=Streptomyces sp. ISL-86 TaxID=2819187 RepID=UPI001BEBF502|nr:CAP domain-containing protein [Streptomyces sp. ISL-86]MBT2456297.1 CAP domain-containing protein [Streptomyces sp. ISL-86]